MPLAHIVNDGLWCCLCPHVTIQRAKRSLTGTLSKRKSLRPSSRPQLRQFVQKRAFPFPASHWPLQQNDFCYGKKQLHNGFFQARPVFEHFPQERDLQETYEELRHVSKKGEYQKVQALARYLIKSRDERPNSRIYDALITANVDAEYGSPAEVTVLLQEMAEAGLQPDAATYHAVLRVLAVHPDHLLRSHVLASLRERWFPLTKDGYHDVITGLIRERQPEVALQFLEQMKAEGMRVSSWLYDMLVYTLCNIGELDEAVRLMHQRLDSGELMISGTVWYHLLDSAANAMHHEATVFAYNARVATSYLNPSSGLCTAVLVCAARNGDTKLATEVFGKLSERSGTPVQPHHYEILVETYIAAGDLRSALDVLGTMSLAGYLPTEASTRAIFSYLKHSRHDPRAALNIIEEMRDQARPIPLAALNVILEAYVYHVDLLAALELYNSINLYTASPHVPNLHKPLSPNTATFNILLRGCTTAKAKAQAMFLASEMVALEVVPDALTYDRLVLVCLTGDEGLDDAWRYVEEMSDQKFQLRGGTAITLARKACELEDTRIERLSKDKGGPLERWKYERLIQERWGKGAGGRQVEEGKKDERLEGKREGSSDAEVRRAV